MKDIIFGEIECNGHAWIRNEILKIFNEEKVVELYVDGDEDEEILESQREAYINLKKGNYISEIEKQIYEYYLSICEEYRGMLEEDADECAPIIHSVEEVGKLVEPTYIVIRRWKNRRGVSILFDCSWDIDAGVGVKIENDKIVEVGDQTVAL